MTVLLVMAAICTVALFVLGFFTRKTKGFGLETHIGLLLLIFAIMLWVAVGIKYLLV